MGERGLASSIIRGLIKPYLIVLQHVFKKPYTLKYPYERLEFSERFRGRIVLDRARCVGCGLCSRVCPTAAVEMVGVEGREKPLPKIDFGRCCFCGLCVDSCPRLALRHTQLAEFSIFSREELVEPPERLGREVRVEEVLEELRRFVSQEVTEGEVFFVERRRVR